MALRTIELAFPDTAYAFTLNLGPERLAKALGDPDGFSDHLRDQLAAKLGYRMQRVPMFCFAVDVSPETGKLHLHGAVEGHLPTIEEAMKSVCGRDWRPARKGERAVDLQPLRTPDRWQRYSLRHKALTKWKLKSRLIAISRPLGALARQKYKEIRKISECD
jgi:hypothetical protein